MLSWVSLITLEQLNILIDRDGHARLSVVEFSSIFRQVSPTGQGSGYDVTRATLENCERPNSITQEVDVFAFGAVVFEVRSYAALRHGSSNV